MLAALGFARGATGVHEEEGRFGVLRHWFDNLAAIVLDDIFDEIIAFADHRRFGHALAGITTPDEDLVDLLALFFCGLNGDVGIAFVVDPFAVAVVAVRVNKNAAAGIGGAEAAGFAAEAAEDDRVDDAEAGASEHGDGQLGNHGHVNGDAVAGFEAAKITEHGGGFVYANVEFTIGEHLCGFVLGLGYEDKCGFVFVLSQMAVNAVVRGVEFASDEPFPEWRVRGIESLAPLFIPVKQVGVVVEAARKILFGEFLYKGRIGEIRLRLKFLCWMKVVLFFPMDGDLGFSRLVGLGRPGLGRARVRFCFRHERFLRREILTAVEWRRELAVRWCHRSS